MKKLFLATILTAALCGCDNNNKPAGYDLPPAIPIHRIYINGYSEGIYKADIDGHEYLLRDGAYQGGICHSASCPCHTNYLNRIDN